MAGDTKAREADAAPAKGASKAKLFIIIGVVLALAGGGGAWFFLKKHPDDDEHAGEKHESKSKKVKVFLPIDPFTVNLAGEHNRFAQVAVTFELEAAETAESIKAILPAVRDRILRLIAAKSATELLSSDGKETLAGEITENTAILLGWEPPESKPKKKAGAKGKGKHDDEDDEDEDAEPAKGAKGAKGKAVAKKSKPRRSSKPNPIAEVHFAQFIIQ